MAYLIEFKNHKKELLRGVVDKNLKALNGAIFVHGFERNATEKKFKNSVDGLKQKTNLFRFDFSGCGLSDGKFENTTVEKMSRELEAACGAFLKENAKMKKINIVSHSLGGCIVLKWLEMTQYKVDKLVFLAPAFNQRALLRYWFVKSQYKNEKEIGWNNYQDYLDDKKFQDYIAIRKRELKEHFIQNAYFAENEKIDYQNYFEKFNLSSDKILIVHGDGDDKVPMASNDRLSKMKRIIVAGGDHDLEKPTVVKKYLPQMIRFLDKK
jgi:pimeloyl-ACP methyl ester carboxylesterase